MSGSPLGARCTQILLCPRTCAIWRPALRRQRNNLPRWLAAALLTCALPASAIDRVAIEAERIDGHDWQARGVSLAVGLNERGRIQIRELQLPEPIGEISNAAITCDPLLISPAEIHCESGSGKLPGGLLREQDFALSFRYTVASGELQLSLTGLPSQAGDLNLQARYAKTGWQVDVRGEDLDIATLVELATPLLDDLQDVTAEGSGSLNATLAGHTTDQGTQLRRYDIDSSLQLSALDALNHTVAAENFSGRLRLSADTKQDGVAFDLDVQGNAGQFYADPVLVDFSANPASIQAKMLQQVDGLLMQSLHIDQKNALQANLDGDLRLLPEFAVRDAEIEVKQLNLPGGYALLQPFLIGTAADSLETLGNLSGQIRISENQPVRVDLKVDGLHVDDREGRFALYDSNGELHWSATETAAPSRLSWEGGEIYKLVLEASSAQFTAGGGNFRLDQPLTQPILEGALNIRELDASRIGQPDMRLRFNAEVAPIDLEKLTRTLEWPEFGGTLSGRLPALEYADGQLVLQGTLSAEVFDGKVTVDKLRIEDPLGDFPVLYGDMRARNLDLKQATEAFSFGRIQGRLNADVRDLSLVRWRPVAFDARLYTPPAQLIGDTTVVDGETLLNDKPHRISQRAIENISDLGGSGAAGVLSRGFLGVFDDFAYDQISLGCRLRDGICHMQGLEPKDAGYYIVKGRLLPRIDVIGYARQVSWASLLEQLQNIQTSEGPVVQ